MIATESFRLEWIISSNTLTFKSSESICMDDGAKNISVCMCACLNFFVVHGVIWQGRKYANENPPTLKVLTLKNRMITTTKLLSLDPKIKINVIFSPFCCRLKID